jgi:predicted glutamine amidotransferase
MCRLLGIVANKEVDFRFSLFGEASKNLRTQSEDNPDGWGIAIFSETGQVAITKSPLKASGDRIFDQTASSGVGRILVAHVRKASSGSNRLENTHPFEMDGWVFAHNGTIHNKEKIEKNIEPSFMDKVKGDTDSERYFALILSQFARDRILPDSEKDALVTSLSSAIKRVRDEIGGSGLNFLLSNGRFLFAFKNGRSLYLLKRDSESIPEVQLQSKETGALLQWKKSAGEKAVLIASEKVTSGEHWEEIQENQLICIDRNLNIEKRKIRKPNSKYGRNCKKGN